ncbi:MAG: bifunctional pyr operon transcriptional regulator/uracil phosphoribosyltransferase PyrR [Clostridia bacterium]|nr:bifunctional pyr operon transcriptional regulator/uracil phosphoribosyltransferase PyrR [Clostridia bacterium]
MTPKTKIMDEVALGRAVGRITHEIMERNQGLDDVCIFGIKRRGVPLAKMLCDNIERFFGVRVPMGQLDVTIHRDDLTDEDKRANAGQSELPCSIQDKTVIIVDDVLYTGRTARAALETVFAFGRPRAVQFVALIDRGHRELPLRPDYVGKNVPTAKNETVRVLFDGANGEAGVYICTD